MNNPTGVKFPRHTAAMWFDGSNDYVEHTAANFRSADTSGTVTAWVWFGVSGTYNILTSSYVLGTTYYIALRITNGKVEITQRNNDTADLMRGANVLTVNAWHHVSLLSTGTSYQLYINAQSESLSVITGTNTGDWFADTQNRGNLVIGQLKRLSSSGFFHGGLRDVHVYNRALSQPEIAADMAGSLQTNLVANWKGNGNTSANWQDLSGNGYNGTVNGSPEQCLIHQRGAIIRTDVNNNRYKVT